jgi:O-antigen ligase
VIATVVSGLVLGWLALSAVIEPSAGGGRGASRLASTESHRYDYWRVAAGAFAHHPVRGLGASGFRVEWLRKRDIPEPVGDVHSLYLETAAELGVVGLALLALFLGGVAACIRRLAHADPLLVAGPAAALAVWAVQAGVDWIWEMPAYTLVAIVLAAALVAWQEAPA